MGQFERTVYVSGAFIPESQAKISIYDTALATGEVVTEVTRTFHQQPFRLEDHINRLFIGLEQLAINPNLSKAELASITLETLEHNLPTEAADVEWQIIHYISRGPTESFGLFESSELYPTVIINCIPLVRRLGKMAAKYERGIDIVVSDQRAIPVEVIPPQIKSRGGRLDYILARVRAGGASAVLLDTNGYLTEGTGSSLFLVRGDHIETPPAYKILSGVTRGLVLELAAQLGIEILASELTVGDAATADEIFMTSTVICLHHGRSFNGQLIGDGSCGRMTRMIRQAFSNIVGLDFVEQAKLYSKLLKG